MRDLNPDFSIRADEYYDYRHDVVKHDIREFPGQQTARVRRAFLAVVYGRRGYHRKHSQGHRRSYRTKDLTPTDERWRWQHHGGAQPSWLGGSWSRASRGHMSAFSLSADGKLIVAASNSSSNGDFDYLPGRWNIRNRTLTRPLTGSHEWKEFDATQECKLILHGRGNIDLFSTKLDDKPFEGLTVRLFDPKTRLWTIYWADSEGMKLDDGKVGSFDGDEGDFFGREVVDGRDVIVKFHWNKSDREAPVYSRAFSADAGRSWEWNWYSQFSRH